MASGAETQAGPAGAWHLPPLPKIWIGYLLGFAALIAEVVAVSLHPEMATGAVLIPPLYLFLPVFVAGVYWLVCVYQYHVIVNHVPGWHHTISPAKAVGYHFIPVFNLYWVFKWLQEIAGFVNSSLRRPVMRPNFAGAAILIAVVLRFFDAGLGTLMLFMATSYVSTCLRSALAAFAVSGQAQPPQGPPPFS